MNSHKLELLFFIVYGLRSTEQGSKQICLDPDSDSAYRTWSEQSEMMFLCVCVGDGGCTTPAGFPPPHPCLASAVLRVRTGAMLEKTW